MSASRREKCFNELLQMDSGEPAGIVVAVDGPLQILTAQTSGQPGEIATRMGNDVGEVGLPTDRVLQVLVSRLQACPPPSNSQDFHQPLLGSDPLYQPLGQQSRGPSWSLLLSGYSDLFCPRELTASPGPYGGLKLTEGEDGSNNVLAVLVTPGYIKAKATNILSEDKRLASVQDLGLKTS